MNYGLLKHLHVENFPNAHNHFHPTKGKIPITIFFSPLWQWPSPTTVCIQLREDHLPSSASKPLFLFSPPSTGNLLFIVVTAHSLKERKGMVLWIYPPTWRADTFNILKCLHRKYVHRTGNWHYKIPSLFSFRFTQFQDSLLKQIPQISFFKFNREISLCPPFLPSHLKLRFSKNVQPTLLNNLWMKLKSLEKKFPAHLMFNRDEKLWVRKVYTKLSIVLHRHESTI